MTRAPRVYCRTTRSWKNCVTPESISRAAPLRNIAKPCAYPPQSSAGGKNWQPAPEPRPAYAPCRIDVRNIFKVKSLGAWRPHSFGKSPWRHTDAFTRIGTEHQYWRGPATKNHGSCRGGGLQLLPWRIFGPRDRRNGWLWFPHRMRAAP